MAAASPLPVLLAILAVAVAASAAAEPPPDEEVEQRLAFLEQRLDRHRSHARIWQWSWTVVNGGAAIGLGLLGGLADDKVERVSFLSQSALGVLGLADLYLLRPMAARDGFDPLRRTPAGTAAERFARMREAEALLRRAARRLSGRDRWWPHLANLAINSAVGFGVWAAGDGADGLVSALSGGAVGEVYLWSEPYGWRDDLRDYERLVSGQARAPEAHWSLVASPGGLAVRVQF